MQLRSSLPARLLDGAVDLVSRRMPSTATRRRDAAWPVSVEIPVDSASLRYFRREAFPAAGPVPWLDRPDAARNIEDELAAGRLSMTEARLANAWIRDGFVILPRFFTKSRIDAAWAAYEAAIAGGALSPQLDGMAATDPLPGRVLNPHLALPAFDEILRDRGMLDVVGMLLGAKPAPFQTIGGHKGSEQPAHSDTMHMTTYPLGYLVAGWIAFEDIHPDSGPLVYYPGSHRLPYLTSVDLDLPVPEQSGARPDYEAYHTKYEPAIADLIAEHRLEPAYFTPQAGDVLLWHANLIHGGSARRTKDYSRKSLVCHYFAEGCVTYHDYTATASRLELAKIANRKSIKRLAFDTALGFLERSLRVRP
jgi:hypothetical protein